MIVHGAPLVDSKPSIARIVQGVESTGNCAGGDQDLLDSALFQQCIGTTGLPRWDCADLDGDGDIDLGDLGALKDGLSGPFP